MTTLQYIANKYHINVNQKLQPIEIPNTNRQSLAHLFQELGFNEGIEVGVEEGIYSEMLLNENPKLTLGSVDAWAPYSDYRDHVDQNKLNAIMQTCIDRLKPYGKRSYVIKGFSVDIAKEIPDNSLDFVYLDANHEYKYVVEDIYAWEPKVRIGGIIAGHDYIRRKGGEYLMHVIPAIHGYCDAYRIRPLFVLGRKETRPGELRDSTRSWFYVKQPRKPVVPGHYAT